MTTQARLAELETRKKALAEAIEAEQVIRQRTQDEHSIRAYFDRYCHADFENPDVRDMILEYFVDKIYVYDDRLVITGCYTEDKHEISWEELNSNIQSSEFDDCVLSSILRNLDLKVEAQTQYLRALYSLHNNRKVSPSGYFFAKAKWC